MKRTEPHVQEEKSKRALRNKLPIEWIIREYNPDYGLDMELTIVENELVTNKVLWLQIKASKEIKTTS